MKSIRRQRRSQEVTRTRGLRRKMLNEALENRQMMAADLAPHHNYAISADVDANFKVEPLDALVVINRLNANGPGSLVGIDRTSGYVDVNADGQLTPADALAVINRLNNGSGEAQQLAQLLVDVTQNNTSILDANRQFNVDVGEDFDLEVKWLDKRDTLSQAGLFTVYADILAKNSDKFIPVVGESQVLEFTDDVESGSITISGNGKQATLTVAQFISAVTLRQAFENTLGYGAGSVRVVKDTIEKDPKVPTSKTIIKMAVTFIGSSYVLKDVPDVTVDTTNLVVKAGVNKADAFKVLNVAALVNENGDGKVTPNEINPAAILANVDPTSFSFIGDSGRVGRQVYVNGRAGSYVPNAPVVSGSQELFNEIGAFAGTRTIAQVAEDNSNTVDFATPFEAFSIKLRAIAPTTAGSPVELTVDKPDVDGHEVLLYGVDYQAAEFNIPNKNDFIGIDAVLGTVKGIIAPKNEFTAVDDTATVPEGGTVAISVLTNDINPGSGAITIEAIPTQGTNGNATINGNQVSYQATGDFFGQDTFTYRIRSATNELSVATVTVTITPVNDPPTVQAKTLSTAEGTPGTITEATLIAGSSAGPANEIAAGQTVTVKSVTPTSEKNGSVSFNGANRQVVYIPPAGFVGTDTFQFTATDGTDDVVGTVTVTVTAGPTIDAVNDGPITVLQGSTTQLNVLQNDTGTGFDITAVSTPSSGSVTIAGDKKSVSYTAAAAFTGNVTFTYTITAGSRTDTATVTVTVSAQNDPPNAVDNTFSVEQNSAATALDVLANDNGGNADPNDNITITNVTDPSGGTAVISGGGKAITFTPDNNFSGQTTFNYTITDSANQVDTATVTINVTAPVRPKANTESFTTAEETPITINITNQLLNNDLPNAGQTIVLAELLASSLVGPGSLSISDNGTVTPSDDTVTFTPADDFNGEVKFTYRVSDTGGVVTDQAAATATVTINVTPVNDPPTAVNDPNAGTVGEDPTAPLQFATSVLLANDSAGPSNESGQTLTVQSVTAVTQNAGTITLNGTTVEYAPAGNFNGPFVFTYVVSDGQSANNTAVGTATITVTAVNDAPVANNDGPKGPVEEDATVALNIPVAELLANDTTGASNESDTLTVTGVSATSQSGGTVSLAAGVVSYKPGTDFFGSDTFTYTISDGNGGTATGTVTVTVNPVNDPPTALDKSASTGQGTAVTITAATLLTGASAGPANEQQTLSVTEARTINGVTQGTVVRNVDGSITYTPPAGQSNLTDRFQYVVSDGVATVVREVTVTVSAFQGSSFKGQIIVDKDQDGVLDSNEKVLGGVDIVLKTPSGATQTVKSDSDGNFTFTGLTPGEYSVHSNLTTGVEEGLAFAGAGATANQDEIKFTIGAAGGANLTGNLLTIEGFDETNIEKFDRLMGRFYNPAIHPTNIVNEGVLSFQVDGTGKIMYYRSDNFDANGVVARVTATVDVVSQTIALDVLTKTGELWHVDVPKLRTMFVALPDGTFLIGVFGNFDSLDFQQVQPATPAAFAASVDELFGKF